MTSGEAISPARDCLKGEEIDPTGQAQLCADPCDPKNVKQGGECIETTVQPTPTAAPSIQAIPRVGVSATGFLVAFLAGIAVAYVLYMYDNRK